MVYNADCMLNFVGIRMSYVTIVAHVLGQASTRHGAKFPAAVGFSDVPRGGIKDTSSTMKWTRQMEKEEENE
jgi:hypothetical protein